VCADRMAAEALALAFGDRSPAGGVAAAGVAAGRRHGSEIRDDLPDLRFGHAARGHRRPWNAARDDAQNLAVVRRAAIAALAEVRAADAVAFRTVTADAVGGVEPPAGLDFDGKIFLLGERRHGDATACQKYE